MPWPAPLPLDNGNTRSTFAVAIVFTTIATLAVAGRISARRIKKVGLGIDDWVLLPALMAVYAQMVIIILSVIYGGVGHHIRDLNGDNLEAFFKLITAVQFSFGTSLGLAKISICLLLIRVFVGKRFRIVAWCVMAYCICWNIMVISIGAGLCRPFAYNWDKTIPGGECGALRPAYISIAVTDIVGDALIVALPMRPVWKLQISTATKIGLSAIFALAFLDIIVAILRIIYLANTTFEPPADFTWDSTGTYTWSVIEPSLGVTIACTPVLRPLFSFCFSALRSKLSSFSPSYAHKLSRDKDVYSAIENGQYPLHDTHRNTAAAAIGGKGSTENTIVGEAGKSRGSTSVNAPELALDPSIIRVENAFEIHSLPRSF